MLHFYFSPKSRFGRGIEHLKLGSPKKGVGICTPQGITPRPTRVTTTLGFEHGQMFDLVRGYSVHFEYTYLV